MEITRAITTYHTEEVPETFDDFKDWSFSSGGTTGQDFKRFARLFKNYLKKALSSKGLQVTNYSSGHYILSGFVTNSQQYVYFSVSDVRHFPGAWHNNILVRTAKHEKDYTGGSNNFCSLQNLTKTICELL